jgi:hypothetical protein
MENERRFPKQNGKRLTKMENKRVERKAGKLFINGGASPSSSSKMTAHLVERAGLFAVKGH